MKRLVLLLFAIFFAGICIGDDKNTPTLNETDTEKINAIIAILSEESLYKFPKEVLLEQALRGMAYFDPYSRYLKKEELKRFEDEVTFATETVRSSILEKGVGYIYISSFSSYTGGEFAMAIDYLQGVGLNGLILDLRNNSGGSVGGFFEVAELILDEEEILMQEKDNNGVDYVYHADSRPDKISVPIVVLVNRKSASMSEVLAAALQDNNKAIILGEKTFGKGISQAIRKLPDGSAVKFTVSILLRSNGKPLHGVGVIPDIVLDEKSKDLFIGDPNNGQGVDMGCVQKKDPWLFDAVQTINFLVESR